VAGLVAITPAAGFVDAKASIIIGAGAGVVCYGAAQLKHRLKVDDALDVWAVHGVGGAWGAIATGLFATTLVNSAGVNGLFFGNPAQVGIQIVAVLVTSLYAGGATWVILKLVDRFVGLRVPEAEEIRGLDTSQHGEPAYQL
jgi:Amt family ammonium transporter